MASWWQAASALGIYRGIMSSTVKVSAGFIVVLSVVAFTGALLIYEARTADLPGTLVDCQLHDVAFERDTVRVSGERCWVGVRNARLEDFPHSNPYLESDSLRWAYDYARIWFCPACRHVEEDRKRRLLMTGGS